MAKDFLLDDDMEMTFKNGDFNVDNSDEQHVILLVNTNLGSWKQSPLVGVGILQYSASAGQGRELKRNISSQMAEDGFVDINVSIRTNELDSFDYYINASRLD